MAIPHGFCSITEAKCENRFEIKEDAMGVSKKGRRAVPYKKHTFVWWVGKDPDSCDQVWLNIISENKSIVLSYRVGEGDFFIISKGRMFQGKATSGRWEYYKYPMASPPTAVTPNFVYNLIVWAVDGDNAIRLDCPVTKETDS